MSRTQEKLIEFVCPICKREMVHRVTLVFPQPAGKRYCLNCLKKSRPEEARVALWEEKWGLVEQHVKKKKKKTSAMTEDEVTALAKEIAALPEENKAELRELLRKKRK
jgi:hypothetical protein